MSGGVYFIVFISLFLSTGTDTVPVGGRVVLLLHLRKRVFNLHSPQTPLVDISHYLTCVNITSAATRTD